MPNLLPEHSKKNIRKEYRQRVLFVALIFVLAGEIIGIMFMVPTYIILSTEHSGQLKKKEMIANTVKATEEDAYIAMFSETNNKVLVLNSGLENPSLLELVSKIMNQKTPGILISSIEYRGSTSEVGHLVLTGRASTREALINFKNSVQSEKSFTKVAHAVSDLIKAENSTFTLTIDVAN